MKRNNFLKTMVSIVTMLMMQDIAIAKKNNELTETIINVSGVIVDPPECEVNNNKMVEIDFGDTVGIKKINTGIYKEPIDFTLECEENKPSLGFSLYLTVEAESAAFDPDSATVVTREFDGLGVKIYNNEKPLPLNTPVLINVEKKPKLEAVLVAKPDVELVEGDFSAGATLKIEYN